jgi:hypothetical protein
MATASARRLVALLALPAVVVAAGCGGKSAAPATTTAAKPVARTQHLGKKAYVTAMQQLGRRLGKTVEAVYPIDTGLAGSDTSRATIAKLQKGRTSVEAVLVQLQRIDPPAAVRADHRQIERGVRGMAAEMQAVIVALRAGDLAASMAPAALPSLRVVTSATDHLEHEGYDVLAVGPKKS